MSNTYISEIPCTKCEGVHFYTKSNRCKTCMKARYQKHMNKKAKEPKWPKPMERELVDYYMSRKGVYYG